MFSSAFAHRFKNGLQGMRGGISALFSNSLHGAAGTKYGFEGKLSVFPTVFDELGDGLCARKSHILNRLHQRGQRRQRVFRHFKTVDCYDGAILRNALAVVATEI